VAGTSGIGSVTTITSNTVEVSTPEMVGGIGSVTFDGDANVFPTGVEATCTTSGVNVWGLIDDSQTANWASIDDSQTPGWSTIDDSQTPDWKEVA
jgi:hypothetical protein